MGLILRRANEALDVNPPPDIEQRLTVNGSSWLWACFAIYTLLFIGVFGLSFKPKSNEKIFHYLLSMALLVGVLTYFANASDLGWSVVSDRQIFFSKYINWVVSFPIVNILLGLVANLAWPTIVYNVFLSWVWVISYLVAAYTPSVYKWGFFVFGTISYLAMAASTFVEGSAGAKRVGTAGNYWILVGYFNLLWLLYPIAFAVSEGGNKIGVTPHFIFFGILDLLMMPFGSIIFLLLARKWDYNALNLSAAQRGRAPQSGHLPEKSAAPAPPAPTAPAAPAAPAPSATPATTTA